MKKYENTYFTKSICSPIFIQSKNKPCNSILNTNNRCDSPGATGLTKTIFNLNSMFVRSSGMHCSSSLHLTWKHLLLNTNATLHSVFCMQHWTAHVSMPDAFRNSLYVPAVLLPNYIEKSIKKNKISLVWNGLLRIVYVKWVLPMGA